MTILYTTRPTAVLESSKGGNFHFKLNGCVWQAQLQISVCKSVLTDSILWVINSFSTMCHQSCIESLHWLGIVHTLKVVGWNRHRKWSSWNYDKQELAHDVIALHCNGQTNPISAFLADLTATPQLNHSAAASPPFLHEPDTHTALGGVTFTSLKLGEIWSKTSSICVIKY